MSNFKIMIKNMNLLYTKFKHFLKTYFAFDLSKSINNIRGLIPFLKDYRTFKKQKMNEIPFGKIYPCLTDKFETSGTSSGHYFHQDLFVAQQVFRKSPLKHVDIGSRVDGFIAHVAAYRNIEVFDIRTNDTKIENIEYKQLNLAQETTYVEYTDSLSCLHALEHFGLGRYGDPIDVNGHGKGLNNFHKMLKTSGTFYLSVPIGPLRIEYNAHRVFSIRYIFDMIQDKFKLISFSYVNDAGYFYKNVKLTEKEIQTNVNCKFGCGIFILSKI